MNDLRPFNETRPAARADCLGFIWSRDWWERWLVDNPFTLSWAPLGGYIGATWWGLAENIEWERS
jgi:hypothetical protein